MSVNIPNARSAASGASSYAWANPWGGAWDSAANWIDANTGLAVASPPDIASAASIVGGAGSFTNVVDAGAAASLGIANDVILWGLYTVAGGVSLAAPGGSGYTTPDLELDGGASLAAASLSIADGTLQAGSGSTVTVSGAAILNQAFLLAINGGGIQLGSLIANNIYNGGTNYVTPLIAVDDASFIQAGTSAGAALGAFTIDPGQTATVSGAIDANVALNGMLAVQGGNSLAINGANPFGSAKTVAGGGTLVINEGSTITLSIADSSAIQFAAPNGTLSATTLPGGAISGFAPGDVIEFLSSASPASSPVSSLATGLSYQQTTSNSGRLTLTKAGQPVGTLAFAGNYASTPFHLSLDAAGNDFITVQTIGGPPAQPRLITGTPGSDTLYATANGQTLTGLGGTDILQARSFTGITFQDTSANLNGSTITSFGLSDIIDLTDMKPATASATYSLAGGPSGSGASSAVLAVTDGTHTAVMTIAFNGALPTGTFIPASDGAAGTGVQYVAVNTDALTFSPTQGGSYGVAANWLDAATQGTASKAPGVGNAVTLAGGSAYSGITGNGVAASLATSGDVLLWGSLNVGGTVAGVSGALTQAGTLALDGGGAIVLAGNANVGGLIEIGPGSSLTAAGGLSFTANGASLLAVGGGSARFAQTPGANSGSNQVDPCVIAVDTASAIEFGSAGGAARGALTIDAGMTANLLGSIKGNMVVNGTLAVVQGGTLAIGPFGPASSSVTGSGTLAVASAGTLILNGSDSAAILFGPVAASSALPETLALNGALPVGTITGFGIGDAITVARGITGVSYTQAGGAGGTLTLLNGSAAVGAVSLAGGYAAGQFLVTPSADARSSTITYLAAPNTMIGNQVSDNSHTYNWTSANGGAWSNPANWIDTASGATPMVAPSGGNAVVFGAVTGGVPAARIVSGSGSAASLLVGQYDVFTGTLAVGGVFSVQGYQSEALLENGASLSVGSLSDSSALAITGNSTLVAGASAANTILGALTITGGSVARLLGGTANALGGTIAVDGASSFEIGGSGGAAAGALTIDNGMTATASGGAIKANLVVNGSLTVANGVTTVDGFGGTSGSIRGTGTISLQSATLALNASDAASIAFRGGSASTLELKGPLPTGAISGFVSGDLIRVDQTVTGVSFRQATSTQGTLTLTNGAASVGTLLFNGNYTASLFQVDVAPATGIATVSLQTAVSAGTLAAASTGRDAYAWVGPSGGTWATAANWSDTTTASVPTTSPGSGNAVSLTGAAGAGQYATIGGNGTAASLAVSGGVLLKGQVIVAGRLSLAAATGPAALTLNGSARMTAATAAISGRLEAESASVATISSVATLTGGSLLALGGSTAQLGGLIGNGSGNMLAIDASSAVRIGNVPVAVAGALTQAAGSTVAMTGAIYGSVFANGLFAVAGGGALFIDLSGSAESDPYAASPTIGGTGTFSLTENSTLGLGVADTAAIRFAGPNATLVLATPTAGVISGFMAGDQIQVNQGVTGLSYRQNTASAGTLTLTRGSSVVGALQLAGSYGVGNAFHLDAGANGNTAVITLQSLGLAATQPTLIQGTGAADLLTATANGQTISGLGGGDTLNGGSFAGIGFMDLTANMNGCAIQGFVTSDRLDFTDMIAASATLTYAGGHLGISDGTHSASLSVGFASMPATGAFHAAADGTGGTKVTWA